MNGHFDGAKYNFVMFTRHSMGRNGSRSTRVVPNAYWMIRQLCRQFSRWVSPVWKVTRVGYASVWLGVCLGAEPLQIAWTNNLLTVSRSDLPGGPLKVLYLEAFLRPGANVRDWGRSRYLHKTRLVEATTDRRLLRFETEIGSQALVTHEIRAGEDELDLTFEFRNRSDVATDLQWFQPACIRVDAFTGTDQHGYTGRSFIFTGDGLRTLDRLRRTTNALYRGGQVYVPAHVNVADANPRPVCLDRPVNGLIGCFSSDNRWILATASSRTHELFEGVYVCLHSDPLIGGLKAGETRFLRQKIYLMPNEQQKLLERYRRDFPESGTQW